MNHITIYSPLRELRKGESPGTPFVHIAVGANSRHHDHILLSAELVSPDEVDEAVKQLKSELDEFAKAAKHELQSLHQKMRGT